MTSPDRANSEQPTANGSEPRAARESLLAIALLSCGALAVVFWGLAQLDVPVARVMRSLYHPVGYLPNPWLAWFSEAGDALGQGRSLVLFSLALLAVGVLGKWPVFRATGLKTLIAHGAVALLVNVLKHVIGRPRPKFMHAGTEQLGPSMANGFDSFPSGHASASFAVAMVVSKHYPRVAGVAMGVAGVVAMSRVLRGSHFPTDVAAGAVLGVLVGAAAAEPWRQWPAALSRALLGVTTYLAAAFAFLWTISHGAESSWSQSVMLGLGSAMMLYGIVSRVCDRHVTGSKRWMVGKSEAKVAVGVGLAVTTGSPLVAALALGVCAAWWLVWHNAPEAGRDEAPSSRSLARLLSEGAWVAGIVLAFLMIQSVKGAVLIP
jgi:undecaprenyl-diphosphatase